MRDTCCSGLLQEGEQFKIFISTVSPSRSDVYTKVSSSPKDTFPKAQQFCFLSMHALHRFILIVNHISFVFKKCGVLLESFKNKTSCPTSVVGGFFEQFK